MRWSDCGFAGLLLTAACVALSCGNGDTTAMPEDKPVFPSNYRTNYTLVRDCMQSADHDLNNVRILADDAAAGPYQSRTDPFPEGAVVLKEEYELGDDTCSGDIKQWTVMQKLAEGSSSDTLDWSWQQVDAQRSVVSQDAARCIGCHQTCGLPPDGYEGTCAIPQ